MDSMHHVSGIRPGRSCSLGSRTLQWIPEKGGHHVEPHNAGFMQASAGRRHVDTSMNAYNDQARPYVLGSKPPPLSPRCFSPVPSLVSTPTASSFGPLSSRSLQSTVQTSPPPTARFCHSRESTVDLDAKPPAQMYEVKALGALLEQTSISSPSGGQHRRGSASLDVSNNRHRRVHSKDLSRWHRNASWIQGISQPSEFGSAEDEDEDEDLRRYRQEAEVVVLDTVKAKAPTITAPSTTTGREEDDPTAPLSEAPDAPEPDADGESILQADRVAKELLNTEFDLFLGSSEPPPGGGSGRLQVPGGDVAFYSIRSQHGSAPTTHSGSTINRVS